jgi:Domain of unknown function (DUF1911)/Domain of unknown function (DUF1910)
MKTPRDKFKDQAYFDRHLRRLTASIDRFRALIAARDTEAEHRLRLQYTVSRQELERLITAHSRGEPPEALRERFPSLLRALAEYQEGAEIGARDFDYFDAYVRALWIVSLAFLLEVPETQFATAVDLLDNEGHDALFDRLVALRKPWAPPVAELMYPDPYQPLLQALDASGGTRTKLILEFLQRYYPGMSSTYWHNSHLSDETGYFGYWCFELAAFVKALGIPDDAFADHPFYPRDLVLWKPSART